MIQTGTPPEIPGDDHKQRAYFDNPRDEMLAFIPAATRTLLDVGCGRGAFASNIKHKRGVEAWGIELNPQAAKVATTRLDRVLQGDIMTLMPTLPAARFDCVVFNDVLEHLVDPYAVVTEARRLLSPSGVVVASLPNVRYWQVALDLLWRGKFDYADSGVLDRTHLRFFTKRSIASLFEERGYRVTLHGINGPRTPARRLVARLAPPRFRDMQYMQYAVIAEHEGRR